MIGPKPGGGLVTAALLMLAALSYACAQPPAQGPAAEDASFVVDGRTIQLKGGAFEEAAAPGSASKIKLQLTGKQAAGDLDGDGKQDTAVGLTYSGGGSGAFYHVAVLLSSQIGRAAETVLLGDRITLETVAVENGRLRVEFLDRRSGEAFAAPPTVHTRRDFRVSNGRLTPVSP